MATIAETNDFNAKSVFVNSDGDIVIYHGEENVILDREQAKGLVGILTLYIATGDID
ncbi:hypothetical protein P3S30_16020 [Enterobacter hormaechei]|uniref:hypothetical protein n=1 Tax=Enterobacter hormaechei TaxID=158836 RepID=UPI00159EDA4C|nr:hypothetical protein [Enterobacter hormaechei]MDF3709866.1 hypothetical protein [Enterobacter hormaechei]